MRFITLFETARRDGVGEDKERFCGTEFCVQSFDQKIVLMVEHCLEPDTADVAVGCSVNGVTECHVIGRHGLGDCAGCATDAKESARYFLSRANFSEGAVLRRSEEH